MALTLWLLPIGHTDGLDSNLIRNSAGAVIPRCSLGMCWHDFRWLARGCTAVGVCVVEHFRLLFVGRLSGNLWSLGIELLSLWYSLSVSRAGIASLWYDPFWFLGAGCSCSLLAAVLRARVARHDRDTRSARAPAKAGGRGDSAGSPMPCDAIPMCRDPARTQAEEHGDEWRDGRGLLVGQAAA